MFYEPASVPEALITPRQSQKKMFFLIKNVLALINLDRNDADAPNPN
jgi:hypothetical protein